VTHDIDEAFLLGDYVAILEEGAGIVQHGTPEDIVANPANDFVEAFIGADRGARALRIEERSGQKIVVDGTGRVAGRLTES
jgi:osmoprotectant transport system ATP-binding protein